MITNLTCCACGKAYDWQQLIDLCECGKPLKVNHDLQCDRDKLPGRKPTMWRYGEVLPGAESPVSLGEGFTPLHRLKNGWLLKDESLNPTGSFKARGMSVAVTMAKKLGATHLAAPSAGNAGGALAAYAAAAGLPATVYMPKDTPAANIHEARIYGADVVLIDGVISDCGAALAPIAKANGWFDVSTLKEPYRVEGKKTLGYEIAEQLGWTLPDVILYPTGGGTGLIGMWKAFDEMERMGWIGPKRPRMVVVQADGCAPIARAFDRKGDFAEPIESPHTVASGLRVPKAIGDFIMLGILRDSNGTAVMVSDDDMIAASRDLAKTEGIFAAPEGGATVVAAHRLRKEGWIRDGETVVVFNTASGLKYNEAFT